MSVQYFASCEWITRGKKQRFRWFIGSRYGSEIICTAIHHRDLVSNLRSWMRRRGITHFEFQWDNDHTIQKVEA